MGCSYDMLGAFRLVFFPHASFSTRFPSSTGDMRAAHTLNGTSDQLQLLHGPFQFCFKVLGIPG